MSKISLVKDAPDWGITPWAERLHQSVTALAVHGFLPDAQAKRAQEKIAKEWRRQLQNAQPTSGGQ